MTQIFISYSRKDIAFVRKLAGDLETAGYDVWWDVSNLRGGDDWVRVIPEAIRASDHFIVVLSSNSVASEWVEKEYTQALHLRRRIIPVMRERTTVPFALNTLNYIDFTTGDYAASLNQLLTTLGYTGEPVVPVTSPSVLPGTLYWIPLFVAGMILLALLSIFRFHPPMTPTATPTLMPSFTPIVIPTHTATTTLSPTASVTPTVTLSPTLTHTETITPSPTRTPSPSATNLPFESLVFCVNSQYANTINVRSGPGTIYAVLGEPLKVGTCLTFMARNEEATWLQIGPVQLNPVLDQYIGGWIFRELLGLGTLGPIDLPAVTLTATSTPSNTPTITPTFTPSETPSPTETQIPTETASPIP
ncbi:MAG TPA: toll/interleukin-1 receptor domain-containing protein [Anaerolineales bacterium]|nr:toll/interleukin-1 receptor domain-containing protein [Anaerolineales bacterium]